MKQFGIAKPCSQDWDAMQPDERRRFCEACQKTVHDFSALTRREAERLFRDSGGQLCGRIVRNADGSVRFRPDPWRRMVGRQAQISLMGVSAIQGQDAAGRRECTVKVVVVVTVAGRLNVSGADVRIGPSHGVTDKDGIYMTMLPSGEHSLHISTLGFSPYEKPVSCGGQTHCGERRTADSIHDNGNDHY